MGLPVINIKETDKLSKAMRSGSSFYIADKNIKMFVSDGDAERNELLEAFDEDFLISALEEAERCTTYITPEEYRARMDKFLNG